MSLSDIAGDLIDRNHPDFDSARFVWNGMIDRKPALIVRCANVEDVSVAVRYAAANGLQAVARCGGHSVSGASLPEDGVMIDLAGLKHIQVNPDRRVASIGGGALLGELDAATQAHGLAVTAGVEPETGVGGLTLGGGIGFLARKLGLTIDNLIGAQVVLADGRVVEASEDRHEDLFWALRGGGGQFGIVTRFDFRVHPIGPAIIAAHAYYPLDKSRDVMGFVRDFMHQASEDVALVPAFVKVPPVDPFPAEWHGKACAAVVGCHLGDETEAKRELQPLLELGDMIFGFIDAMPYVEFQKTFAGSSPKGGRYYWKSVFIDDLTDEIIDILSEGICALPGEYSLVFLETLGGAVSRVGVEETAFSNRTALYNVGVSAGWSDPNLDEEVMTSARRLFDRLRPFSDGTVYFNYLDRDEADRVKEGFGANYERLQRIKLKYDPDGRFPGVLGQRPESSARADRRPR